MIDCHPIPGEGAAQEPSAEDLLASPEVSFWLKDALRAAMARDPVDAAYDAELLAAVLSARAAALLATGMAQFGLGRRRGA